MTEERQLVIPGEVIVKSDEVLPGENTEKKWRNYRTKIRPC
jgi:exosome complex RNA-binding protein Csl4